MIFQKSLFRQDTAARALELAAWLRVETTDLKEQIKALSAAVKKQEKAVIKLEGMIFDMKQKELVEEGKHD
jgi:hypothetical protein